MGVAGVRPTTSPRAGVRPRTSRRPTLCGVRGGPLNHAVYDQLKERLLEGRYAGGQRCRPRPAPRVRGQQAARDGGAAPAVGDGMIEIVPQVGCRVARYDLARGRGLLRRVRRLRGHDRRDRRAAAHRRAARRAGRDLRADRRTAGRAATPRSGPTATGSGTDGSTRPSTRWRSPGSWPRPAGACGTCPTS